MGRHLSIFAATYHTSPCFRLPQSPTSVVSGDPRQLALLTRTRPTTCSPSREQKKGLPEMRKVRGCFAAAERHAIN